MRPSAQEFFRWEAATAIAGALLGINPFDQPNVQESKDATNRLLSSVRERGSLTEPAPVMGHGPLSFFFKDGAENPEELLWAFLSQGHPGDYVALLAYLPEEAVDERRPAGDPAPSQGRPEARHHRRVWASLPPLHGTAAQGRSQHGSFHPVDLP